MPQQEEFSGRVKQAWDGFCEKNPVSAKYLLPPHYESENDYLTLQTADNLAFGARKLVTLRRMKKEPREAMKRMAQSGNIIRICELDYDALKMIADAQIGLVHASIDHPLSRLVGYVSRVHVRRLADSRPLDPLGRSGQRRPAGSIRHSYGDLIRD